MKSLLALFLMSTAAVIADAERRTWVIGKFTNLRFFD